MLHQLAPDLWRFEPPHPASRRVAVVAGLHGDEHGPIQVVRELFDPGEGLWENCCAEVTLILGNSDAIACGQRSAPGGADFNRSFGDSTPQRVAEALRIDTIKRAVEGMDIVLDLHQTHLPIAPCAVCPDTPEHLRLARHLGAHQAVTGATTTFLGGMLIDWANRQGILALTLETGQVGDPRSRDVSLTAIAALISEQGAPQPDFSTCKLVEPLRAPGENYSWSQDWQNGSRVSPGTVVANSSSGVLCATVEGALFLPKLGLKTGEVCALQAVLKRP